MPQLAEEDGPLGLHSFGDRLPRRHLVRGVDARGVRVADMWQTGMAGEREGVSGSLPSSWLAALTYDPNQKGGIRVENRFMFLIFVMYRFYSE